MGRRALGLTVAALVAVVAGCSSDDDHGQKAAKRFECLLTAENRARFDVVSDFYDRGRLGTAAQVRREALRLRGPGLNAKSFLDGEGRMVPYGQMSDAQRDTFLTWEKTRRVQTVVGARERAAVDSARAQAAASCPTAD
jgi:hypothetical protein